MIALAAASVAAVAVVAAVIGISVANQGPNFRAAVVDDCDLNVGTSAQVLDEGKSLYLDGRGKESNGLSLDSLVCVMNALDVPDATLQRMSSTRALDGRQTDSFDGLSVEWSYHPDDGLDVLFTKR